MFFYRLPKGSFFGGEMKITKFYLDKASYKAEDVLGNKILVDIDYWKNNFRISMPNKSLETFVKKLLNKKHKVNFVHKMLE